MRLFRLVRSGTALCLVALLGALGTGLPSHHHEGATAGADTASYLVAFDHHSHGTLLVEQNERAPSASVELASRVAVVVGVTPAVGAPADLFESDPLRPMERAPPPGAPRAPPRIA